LADWAIVSSADCVIADLRIVDCSLLIGDANANRELLNHSIVQSPIRNLQSPNQQSLNPQSTIPQSAIAQSTIPAIHNPQSSFRNAVQPLIASQVQLLLDQCR
jgi:hypothetical protein